MLLSADGPHVLGTMLGDGLSDDDDDDDEDTGGSELSDSGPSGLDLDDEGDDGRRGVGHGGREDDNELGSDDDF